MAKAILILEDDPNGRVDMSVEFGDQFDPASQAHQMIEILAQSILQNANSFTKVEDTAPESNVEPNLVVVAN